MRESLTAPDASTTCGRSRQSGRPRHEYRTVGGPALRSPEHGPWLLHRPLVCGAMTAVTTLSASILAGAYDVAIAGGVEHMTHHPMGEESIRTRYLAEKLVDPEALLMGKTARTSDRFPHPDEGRADAYAVASQEKTAKAYQQAATARPRPCRHA